MAAPTLTTYRDAIEHLIDWSGGQPEESDQNRVRRAILSAYRHIASVHDWRYYKRHGRINLVASQATGTVAYSATSRQVTLTGATWPTWARYGRIIFGSDNNVYKASERTSDTVLTLVADFAPVADKDALATYTIYRSEYPLPAGINGIDDMQDQKGDWSAAYVSPEDWMADERHIGGTGKPWSWTVTGSEDMYGQMVVKVSRQPTAVGTLDYLYQAQARPLKYDGYTAYAIGTLVAGTTLVTLSGSQTLPTDIAGSVFRPSGQAEGMVTPFTEQRIVASRVSDTSFNVDANFAYGRAASTCILADPVDVAPYMLTVFERACEHEMAIQLQDYKKAETTAVLAHRALLEAMGRDNLSPITRSPISVLGGSIFVPGRFDNVTFG